MLQKVTPTIARIVVASAVVAAACPLSAPAQPTMGDVFSSQGKPEFSCRDAQAAERQRHQDRLLALKKEDVDTHKDYHNQRLTCEDSSPGEQRRQCLKQAADERDAKRRKTQMRRNEANAEHHKNMLDINNRCQARRPERPTPPMTLPELPPGYDRRPEYPAPPPMTLPTQPPGYDRRPEYPAPPHMTPTQPPAGADPLLAGLQEGSRECAAGQEKIVEAAGAFLNGDFVRTQELLGIKERTLVDQCLQALWDDLNEPVIGAECTPQERGRHIARRFCTYGLLMRSQGPVGKKPPVQPSLPRAPRIREPVGADVWKGQYHVDPFSGQRCRIMGRSRTTRSHATSTLANKGESAAYEAALKRGEIGLQRPAGANVPGVDFITAIVDEADNVLEVIITDVRTTTRGVFPEPKSNIPGSWCNELTDAVAQGRLDLGDAHLESQIREAVKAGKFRRRQINVDYSPQGQGAITGW